MKKNLEKNIVKKKLLYDCPTRQEREERLMYLYKLQRLGLCLVADYEATQNLTKTTIGVSWIKDIELKSSGLSCPKMEGRGTSLYFIRC